MRVDCGFSANNRPFFAGCSAETSRRQARDAVLSLRSAWSRAVVSGLIYCTSQAGAILPPEQGSAKGTVSEGTAPWARTPLGRKTALFEANEAPLRGVAALASQAKPFWGLASGCPPCAAPQWRSHLCCAVYETRHLPRSRRGSRSALPRIASRTCETSGRAW